MSKRYMGDMNDKEIIETIGMARRSFYKYIREMESTIKTIKYEERLLKKLEFNININLFIEQAIPLVFDVITVILPQDLTVF
jgi:thymidylate synthase ThyX